MIPKQRGLCPATRTTLFENLMGLLLFFDALHPRIRINTRVIIIEAIEAAGLKPGQDIVIVSCDGTRAIFQAMIDGKSNCTVEGNPLQGPLLMEMAKKVLAGEKVERTVFVKDSVYPAEIAPMAIQERKY